MTESLVVRSKIKEYIKDMNVSGDFADALSKKCEQLIKDAIERAKANGRRTVQGRDVWLGLYISYSYFLYVFKR